MRAGNKGEHCDRRRVSELEPDRSKSLPSESPEPLGRFSELDSNCSEKQQHDAFTYSYYSHPPPLCFNEWSQVSTNAISLNTNRKDNFTKHNKAAHQSRRYGSGCWLISSGGGCGLLSPVVTDPIHWGGAVLTMSCCCVAANDKATAQKQMTENLREVFAARQTNTAVSWPSLLRIQGSPPQPFIPAIRRAFILDSSS